MRSSLRCCVLLCAMACLVLCARVTASSKQSDSSEKEIGPNDLIKQKRDPDMAEVDFGHADRQDATIPICEKKEKSSVFAFGRCPESCELFSFDFFEICARMVQFGCQLRPCGAGQFTCSLKEDLSDDVTVCPGDKIIFDNVELERLERVRFSIDLKASPVKTDVYLLTDAAGSSSSTIMAAKENFQNIVDSFPPGTDVAYGVGFYRDETALGKEFENIQPLTTDTSAAKAGLEALMTADGGPLDQGGLLGLYRVATDADIGWREGSQRILVHFGANPGHEPTCVSGLPKLTRDVVIEALNTRKISVIAMCAPGGRSLEESPSAFGCVGTRVGRNQASEITAGTGGKLVNRYDSFALVETFVDTFLTRTFDVDEDECNSCIISKYTPLFPISLVAGEAITVTSTLVISGSNMKCKSVGPSECNLRVSESRGTLEKITIGTTKIPIRLL